MIAEFVKYNCKNITKKSINLKKDLDLSVNQKSKSLKVLIINRVCDLIAKIAELKGFDKRIGFTPTMGALHLGHASLMKRSMNENNISIVSIFVNPKQFNSSADLEKYPRTIEKDILFLEKVGVDLVFIPSVDDLYSADFNAPNVDLGRLEMLMEGKMRPGHFDGVIQVLTRLFQLIQPDNAYFGLKDFQQVAVVKKMVHFLSSPVNIVECPIYRESEGLAYSSRNQRLTKEQRAEALFIYQSLLKAKKLAKTKAPAQVIEIIKDDYAHSSLELEYFEIVHPLTLESLFNEWEEDAVACVVAHVGDIRLIDNMKLR